MIFRLGRLGGSVGAVLSASSKGSASKMLGFVLMISGLVVLVMYGGVCFCLNVGRKVVRGIADVGFAVVVVMGVVVVVVGLLVVVVVRLVVFGLALVVVVVVVVVGVGLCVVVVLVLVTFAGIDLGVVVLVVVLVVLVVPLLGIVL